MEAMCLGTILFFVFQKGGHGGHVPGDNFNFRFPPVAKEERERISIAPRRERISIAPVVKWEERTIFLLPRSVGIDSLIVTSNHDDHYGNYVKSRRELISCGLTNPRRMSTDT